MFTELMKYKENGHFFFTKRDSLKKVCNAPTDKSGVFIVFALVRERVIMVYIGHSGEVKADGTLAVRKSGLGGLKDSIVNGTFFGEPRHKGWKKAMRQEKIEALDVYWYVTHNEELVDCPKILEKKLIYKDFENSREFLAWNTNY